MQDRIDALLAAGAQNVWPKFTFFKPRTPEKAAEHVVVAEVLDGVVVLTEAGHALLKSAQQENSIVDVEIVSEKTRKPRAPKKEKVVEDSNEILDDLDLIE